MPYMAKGDIMNKYAGQYVVLDTDIVAVQKESEVYAKLIEAGWFTWEVNEDNERIMTRPKNVSSLSKVLRGRYGRDGRV